MIIEDSNYDLDFVMKYSAKYMKLLNSFIQDLGFIYNTEDRTVDWGMYWKTLKGIEVGKCMQLI